MKDNDTIVAKVQSFMDANYPCKCKDKECPGNYHESSEMVDIVLQAAMDEIRNLPGDATIEDALSALSRLLSH